MIKTAIFNFTFANQICNSNQFIQLSQEDVTDYRKKIYNQMDFLFSQGTKAFPYTFSFHFLNDMDGKPVLLLVFEKLAN